jgi:hypothetical protein
VCPIAANAAYAKISIKIQPLCNSDRGRATHSLAVKVRRVASRLALARNGPRRQSRSGAGSYTTPIKFNHAIGVAGVPSRIDPFHVQYTTVGSASRPLPNLHGYGGEQSTCRLLPDDGLPIVPAGKRRLSRQCWPRGDSTSRVTLHRGALVLALSFENGLTSSTIPKNYTAHLPK